MQPLTKDPDELAAEVRELLARTARIRYEFLRTEMQLCLTTLQMGQYELTLGNIPAVEKELIIARKGIGVVERLLPAASEEEKGELGPRLTELKDLLETLSGNLAALSGKTTKSSGPGAV